MPNKTSALSATSLLRHNALHKGVFGGRRGWLVVGVLMWGPRLLKRLFGRTEEVLATERLAPGQTVTITTLRPPTRAERKAAARAR